MQLEDHLTPSEHSVGEAFDVSKKVGIVDYWSAASTEYRNVGNLYGVTKLSDVLVEHLMHQYVKFPTDDDLKEIVKGF